MKDKLITAGEIFGFVIILIILGAIFGTLLVVLGVFMPILLPLCLFSKGVRSSIPNFTIKI